MPSSAARRRVLPWLMLLTLWWSSPSSGGRPPNPQQAEALVASMVEGAASGTIGPAVIGDWFSRASDDPAERERLLAALGPGGSLGQLLQGRPAVEAVVMGPDYVRIVLATDPHLSFLVRRTGGRAAIHGWEVTRCGACREPARFVEDLLQDLVEDRVPRLSPGVDLWVEAPEGLTGEGELRWRQAWQARNQSAGYLRWLLQGVEVMDVAFNEVKVLVGDRVERLPVSYRDRRWWLDYSGLAPDSPLRLRRDDVARWLRGDALRQAALDWWVPQDRPVDHDGTLVARRATALFHDPVGERWLILLQRPDRKLAGLVAVDESGLVTDRYRVPSWPDRVPAPLEGWVQAWVGALSPDRASLFLSAAGRWWVSPMGEGEVVVGARGVVGNITAAVWCPAGLVVGDSRGALALLDPSTGRARMVRAPRAGAGAVASLLVAPGGGRVVVAWAAGDVVELSVSGLEETGQVERPCGGGITGGALLPRRGEALFACGEGGIAPVVGLSTIGGERHETFDELALEPAGRVFVSPDERWLLLPAEQGGALLHGAADHETGRPVGQAEVVQAAWGPHGASIMTLDAHGYVVRWPLGHEVAPWNPGLVRRTRSD